MTNSFLIRFEPTGESFDVPYQQQTTIRDLIEYVCKSAATSNANSDDYCLTIDNNKELENNQTVYEARLNEPNRFVFLEICLKDNFDFKKHAEAKVLLKQWMSTIPETEMITTQTTMKIGKKQKITTESKFNRWKQSGVNVAGGNGKGQELNQLNHPFGIFIDKKKNIFIADCWNHRIIEWKYDTKEGQIIAGGNGKGTRMDQLNHPTDVIVDQQSHSIIIADHVNRRVIQWINQKQQILIENIDCARLATDKHGFLYVSDYKKNEVRRWKIGEYNTKGIVVAVGNKQGTQLNQLNSPTFIFVDEDQSVYVSDYANHRIMKWRKDAKEGRIVAGGNGQGRNRNQLHHPQGVAVDVFDRIYVADFGNDRVMRWCEGQGEGEIVVDENGKGNQLNYPRGLSFDNEGNLYVADCDNNRIQKFEII
ncbi:unnamed protein product [Adineta steineri]|uniref:Uncharacterized protein n=1 Tax=Adineta steineri TaxID=433720 RepID=A0A814AFZ7_9BILA|nr:unnamed protein product [Adineta steineri]CAF3945409.1 unnamed protein product [Adineta steineri]